jgi:hypothetical protein
VEAAGGGAELTPTVSGRKYRGTKMSKTEAPKKLLKQENSFNKASASVELKVLNSPLLSMDFDFRGLLRRVAEEVEAEIRQMEKELTAARRGTRTRELAAVRDILYEDKWFRIATAVFTQLKKEFAEDGKAAEVIEAAERRLYGLRLEVVEAPLLKIEAAVDREGK